MGEMRRGEERRERVEGGRRREGEGEGGSVNKAV